MSAQSPLGLPRGFLVCTFSACVLAGLVGACAPGVNPSTQPASSNNASRSTAASVSDSTSQSTSHAGLSPLGELSVEPHIQQAEQSSSLVVTSVRAASHDGFDRIVFETTGAGNPGWRVDYVESPTQLTSGDPIEVPGETALEVNITGTTYPFELGVPNPDIGRVEMNTALVSDIVDAGTFEGQSQFIVGIKGTDHPYSVQILDNPIRVVVDILHTADS